MAFYFYKIQSIVPTVNKGRFPKPMLQRKLGSGLSCQEGEFRGMGWRPPGRRKGGGAIISEASKFLILGRSWCIGWAGQGKKAGGSASTLEVQSQRKDCDSLRRTWLPGARRPTLRLGLSRALIRLCTLPALGGAEWG